MSTTIVVQPELIRWARSRVGFSEERLAHEMKLKDASVVNQWETSGELTMSQLEKIAQKTHTPIGYMFLPVPPVERLPIPDFRVLAGASALKPSPNLLDAVNQCQFRQSWLREYLISEGAEPLVFVGSEHEQSDPLRVAGEIREAIAFNSSERSAARTWEDALRLLVAGIEQAGVTVMRSGIVGNNTHRKLDVFEFRGFCLSDKYAPLIFINSADAVSAQMFTLAHELAHVWIGRSGVSDTSVRSDVATEAFCNRVAAEILVPTGEFAESWQTGADPVGLAGRLSRQFKVSALVVLIRAYQSGFLGYDEFRILYDAERGKSFERTASGGGDFYRTQGSRLGKRFIRSVVGSTLEGRITYTEAFQLLGVKKSSTFNSLAASAFGGT